MKKIVLKGRKVVGGYAEGEALVSRQEISGFGSISNEKGVVTEPNHEIKGVPMKDKILVFTSTKGSAGFTYIFFRMKPFGTGPKGAIIKRMNSTSGWGFVFGNVPSLTDLNQDPLEVIATGDYIKLDADKGIVEVTKKARAHKSHK